MSEIDSEAEERERLAEKCAEFHEESLYHACAKSLRHANAVIVVLKRRNKALLEESFISAESERDRIFHLAKKARDCNGHMTAEVVSALLNDIQTGAVR